MMAFACFTHQAAIIPGASMPIPYLPHIRCHLVPGEWNDGGIKSNSHLDFDVSMEEMRLKN